MDGIFDFTFELTKEFENVRDFWDFVVGPPLKFDLNCFYSFKEKHPDKPLTADLGDGKIRAWFVAFVKDNDSKEKRKELFKVIDGFRYSIGVKKEVLLKIAVKTICEIAKEDGDECAMIFFKELLYKNFIVEDDVNYCIREFRKNGLVKLLPLLILKENGEIDVFEDYVGMK